MAAMRRPVVFFPVLCALLIGMSLVYFSQPGQVAQARPSAAAIIQAIQQLQDDVTGLEAELADATARIDALDIKTLPELQMTSNPVTINEAAAMGGLSAVVELEFGPEWRAATMWEALTLLNAYECSVPLDEYGWVVGSYEFPDPGHTAQRSEFYPDLIDGEASVPSGYSFAVFTGGTDGRAPLVHARPWSETRKVLAVRK